MTPIRWPQPYEFYQRNLFYAKTEVNKEVIGHVSDKKDFEDHIKRQFISTLMSEFQKKSKLPINEVEMKHIHRGPVVLFSTELHIFTPDEFQQFINQVWETSRNQTIDEINGGLNLT